MSRIDYGSDLKSLFDTCFMIGIIGAVDWENDEADVNIDGENILGVPIFYHCEGHTFSVEQGSTAFSEGDEVIIINQTGAKNPEASDLQIVGFEDGILRDCCYCPEDSANFACDENNPTIIIKGEHEEISVVDGCPLYTWQIDPDDSGFWFDEEYSITKIEDTEFDDYNIYADTEDNTESATIKVTDRCNNQVECEVSTCDCDVEPDLVYDTENSDDTIDIEGTAIIVVKYGCPPFNWAVTGEGFSFNKEKTTERTNTLIDDGTGCDDAVITVIDDCGTEVGNTVTLLVDTFVYDLGNPNTVAGGSEVTITVTGGVGPFTWSVDAYGLSFAVGETEGRTNLLSNIECTPGGDGDVTVIDACGTEVGGEITALPDLHGEWVEIEDCGSASGAQFTTIIGNIKHVAGYEVSGAGIRFCVPQNDCADLAILWSHGGLYCHPNGKIYTYPGNAQVQIRYWKYEWRCV